MRCACRQDCTAVRTLELFFLFLFKVDNGCDLGLLFLGKTDGSNFLVTQIEELLSSVDVMELKLFDKLAGDCEVTEECLVLADSELLGTEVLAFLFLTHEGVISGSEDGFSLLPCLLCDLHLLELSLSLYLNDPVTELVGKLDVGT